MSVEDLIELLETGVEDKTMKIELVIGGSESTDHMWITNIVDGTVYLGTT